MQLPERWFTEDCVAAAEGKPPRVRSIQVFRNAFFDRWFARAHPAFPLVFYGAVSIAALYYAFSTTSVVLVLMAVACGWLGVSLLEYVLHRFVFHRSFPDTPSGRMESFLTHGYHHAYPDDPDRLVLPPIQSIPMAVFVAAGDIAVFGRCVGLAAFAGSALGYIAYDEIHYLVHHHRPRTAIGTWLRRYHLLHHHAKEVARFGVSSPLWDFVFGTYGRVGRKAREVRRRT